MSSEPQGEFFYSLPMRCPPVCKRLKTSNISVCFFFNLVLENKCLNENEYSKLIAVSLSFSRVKIKSCYACRSLNNEVQVGISLLEVGQAVFV